ncbi:MAG: GDP-mannose 4,6-dehydratase [Candidatus Komeilibacteria bacterium]
MTVRYPIERKNILVLGGAGFLGSHLCEFLLKRGDQVICVDNFITSDVENIKMMLEFPSFEFIRHDITEKLELDDLPELKKFKVKAQGIQEIYNLACPTSPEDFTKLPIETAKANSLGVINSLELARQYNAKYLLVSSSAVYGRPPDEADMINENYLGNVSFIGPRACYNEGKRFAETLVSSWRDHYKMPTRIARVFTAYGPRMMLSSGRNVPDFINNALRNQPIVIHGAETTGSSLCYVKDMVEGLVALMHGAITDPVNLGGDSFHTLLEVAQKIVELTKSHSEISFAESLAFTHRQALPDIALAKDKLGWFPLVSLDQGLAETIAYARSSLTLNVSYGVIGDRKE